MVFKGCIRVDVCEIYWGKLLFPLSFKVHRFPTFGILRYPFQSAVKSRWLSWLLSHSLIVLFAMFWYGNFAIFTLLVGGWQLLLTRLIAFKNISSIWYDKVKINFKYCKRELQVITAYKSWRKSKRRAQQVSQRKSIWLKRLGYVNRWRKSPLNRDWNRCQFYSSS